MHRRQFHRDLGIVTAATLAGLRAAWAGTLRRSPTFLIVSGWQTVNIGDIAHTPGLLALVHRYFPDATCHLWPRDVRGHGVEDMLRRHFPRLQWLKTDIPYEGAFTLTPEIRAVFDRCDILLHGSGPKIFERSRLRLWIEHTGKPYGVCGVTETRDDPEVQHLIERSAFFFTRETASLQLVRDRLRDAKPRPTDFFPDATFGLRIRDDDRAAEILGRHGLRDGEFLCVVSRLRYTPYHKVHADYGWDARKIAEVEAANDRYKEQDHRKLRTVIVNWVRATGRRVLLCPEMTYELDIMDELLFDPLPADVKPMVSRLTAYWITDTAAAVYARAFAVVSMECHSCIIACANGTPAFYVRQREDTVKGQMFYDIGLNDWVFEIDQVEGEDVWRALRGLVDDPAAGVARLAKARRAVDRQYDRCFRAIRRLV